MSIIPKAIHTKLTNAFNFPENMLYLQVATHATPAPGLRTMRLYAIEENQGLVLLTHNTSRKWQDLQNNNQCALCILHPDYTIQIGVECEVTLISCADNPELLKNYWPMINDSVRKYYITKAQKDAGKTSEEINLDVMPDNFGMLLAKPTRCEMLLINERYIQSERMVYSKNVKGEWEEVVVSA